MGPVVRTLLQNIEVLSAGTDIQRDAEGKPQQVQVVNLLVTPDQAELLSLASNEARIQLVLRNPLDQKVDKPAGSGMAQLFTDVKPPKPVVVASAPRAPKAAPASRSYLVEVFNGSKKTETKFALRRGKTVNVRSRIFIALFWALSFATGAEAVRLSPRRRRHKIRRPQAPAETSPTISPLSWESRPWSTSLSPSPVSRSVWEISLKRLQSAPPKSWSTAKHLATPA